MSYPTTLPITEIQQIIAYFEHTPGVTLQNVVEDAYDVLGYALYSTVGSGTKLATASGPVNDADAAKALKTMLPSNNVQATAIPWNTILTILVQLINAWLAGGH